MKISLAITGGGTAAIGKLLENGGASEWLHEVVIPYARDSLIHYLGFEPEKYCSEETARAMAMQAFLRVKDDRAVGYGITASLYSEGQRHDRINQYCVGVQTKSSTFAHTMKFTNIYSRKDQEDITASHIVKFIHLELKNQIAQFQKGSHGRWLENGHAFHQLTNMTTRLIFPGAFNPLHDGHIEMAKIAYEKYNIPITFELCVNNIAKPRLDYIDLDKRILQFNIHQGEPWFNGLLVSARPLFIDKLVSVEKPIFIVGGDTFNRICDPKFNKIPLDETASLYYNSGAKFLVFARKGFGLPIVHPRMLQMVEWAEYNDSGISSSQLRKNCASS